MHRPTICLTAALLALATGLSPASPVDTPIDIQHHTRPAVYAGQQVIQVTPTTRHQLDQALALAEGIWSERVGIGPIELQVTRDSLDDYRALGLNPIVLIDDLQQQADLDWQRIVRADQLAQAQPLNNNRGTSPHDENWFTNFKQYSEINTYINDLAAARPSIASVSSIAAARC